MERIDETKKLYRSRPRMLGGVCGGVAEYFDIDPTIARVIAVILFFLPVFPATICYLVSWIIIPEKH